jgi:hypothetical protein
MKQTKTSCLLLRVDDAVKQLPSPEGKRFATIFEHGTLAVEIYAPRGNIRSSSILATKSIL